MDLQPDYTDNFISIYAFIYVIIVVCLMSVFGFTKTQSFIFIAVRISWNWKALLEEKLSILFISISGLLTEMEDNFFSFSLKHK